MSLCNKVLMASAAYTTITMVAFDFVCMSLFLVVVVELMDNEGRS